MAIEAGKMAKVVKTLTNEALRMNKVIEIIIKKPKQWQKLYKKG